MMRIVALFLAALSSLTAAEWVPLFDGKSLKGWTQCNGKALYKVDSGTIVGTTVEGSPNSFLCTEKSYGDFILEFEVKTDPKLNSGVQFRSHRYARETAVMTENRGRQQRTHEAGRVHGYQVEIATAASGASGGIYDEARRGWVANIAKDPVASKAFRDNEWNSCKVEARGDSIKTWVNGIACADLVDSMDLEGFIALQVHSYKGETPAEVRWRNIRIQNLGKHEWRPLWDGASMKGWRHEGGGVWKVVEGELRGTQPGNTTTGGLLVSDRELSDSTVRLSYKSAAGNSGVFFRRGGGEMGYEVEIDPTRDPGGLQEPGKRGWLVRTGPAADAWYYKPDDWNEMTISAHRSRIVVHINGVKASEFTADSGRRSGRIALQLNPRQALDVRFKDIAVLEPAR